MIIDSIRDFEQINFTINNFNVIRKTVLPSTSFKCIRNLVLYERFFYVIKGTIIFTFKDSNTQLAFGPNSIVYLPYDVTYESCWDKSETGEFISINFILRNTNNEIISLSNKIELLANDYNLNLLSLFDNTHKIWTIGSIGYKTKCKSEFYNIIYRIILNNEHMILKRDSKKIYKALLYIENNYTADTSISELANMVNLKERMFRNIFKKIKGVPPIKYRNNLRLTKAYEMLQSGEFSVIDTALCTGFNDVAYFNRLFKRKYGVPPSKCMPKQ